MSEERSLYAAAGVDLAQAERAKARIGQAVASTRTPLALGEIGAFGGMVRVPAGMRKPVLVMSTDGVGTKVLIARQAGRFDTVGEDLVNHSVNDILVHGAQPVAFLDYIAGAGLAEETVAALVDGVARGCRAHGMALAGGETAQMPDLYADGDFDLAGTIVGVVEEDEALHGDQIVPGDVLLGYASTGLHTNGYTLARQVLLERAALALDDKVPGTTMTVADALLAVHRSYAPVIRPMLDRLHGLAHITGGGIPGNLVRVLPEGRQARVKAGSWHVPPLFQFIQRAGNVRAEEMQDVFNLGIGMIAVLPRDGVVAARRVAAEQGVDSWEIGVIADGTRSVVFDA